MSNGNGGNGNLYNKALLSALLLVAAFTAYGVVANGREISAMQADIANAQHTLSGLPPQWLTKQITELQCDVKDLTKTVNVLNQRIANLQKATSAGFVTGTDIRAANPIKQ